MPMPENAQLSEDGQWWWDEEISDWRQVEADVAVAGEPGFDFDWNGIRFNEADGGVAQADEDLKVAFTVINTGTAPGSAHVVITIDDQQVAEWDSPWTQPGDPATPDGDGYVRGVPPQSGGEHKAVGTATPPGSSNGGYTEATINL